MKSNTDDLQNLRITDRSDTDDGGEEAGAQVYHAFLEEPEVLLRHRFPNKAGGAPAWLEPVNLPRVNPAAAGPAASPCAFYVPLPGQEDTAYHRALFVFMRPSMSCLLLDPGGIVAGA